LRHGVEQPAVAVLGPGREGSTGPQFCSSFSSPSFVATHDFFAKITEIFDFFAFANFRKIDKFAVSIERPKTKSASASARGLRS